MVLEPFALVATSVTVNEPVDANAWVGFWDALVEPSPKFQDHAVGVPVDASVNCTTTFALGADGEKVNAVVGAVPDDDENEPDDDDEEDPPPQAPRMKTPVRWRRKPWMPPSRNGDSLPRVASSGPPRITSSCAL